MSKRKTRDVWIIESNCGYGWDIECYCSNYKEFKDNLKDYRENCNFAIRGRKIREKRIIVGYRFNNSVNHSNYYFWDYESYNQFLNNLRQLNENEIELIYDDENEYIKQQFNHYEKYYINSNMKIF